MHVLVTGGTGFLGADLCRSLERSLDLGNPLSSRHGRYDPGATDPRVCGSEDREARYDRDGAGISAGVESWETRSGNTVNAGFVDSDPDNFDPVVRARPGIDLLVAVAGSSTTSNPTRRPSTRDEPRPDAAPRVVEPCDLVPWKRAGWPSTIHPWFRAGRSGVDDETRSASEPARFSRRGIVGLGLGVGATALAGGTVRAFLFERLRWGEDFFPGTPPDIVLEPQAWTTTGDAITFAVLGDNGTGGRNQMDVARQMAHTYQSTPFGLVLLAGDISYYGSIDDRWEDVFVEPYGPLIDAGVEWELAIGNHEISEKKSEYAVEEIQAQLRRFGKPGTYYSVVHGPAEVFVIDTILPLDAGIGGPEELAWLEEALAASTARWKVALLHHPAYSSGKHGSRLEVREALQPLFAEFGVDVAFCGHDHHYERTFPQDGVTWIVSGAGAKRTRVGHSDFTAHAESTLQFMLVDVVGDTMDIQAITTDGTVIDRVVLEARSAT